jgi:hypothetical protein
MTVILPQQVAFALARSARAKISKTYAGEYTVTYPLRNKISDKRVIYSDHRIAQDWQDFVVRRKSAMITDLVFHAEMTLGITITKTPLTEAQQRAVDSLKEC